MYIKLYKQQAKAINVYCVDFCINRFEKSLLFI